MSGYEAFRFTRNSTLPWYSLDSCKPKSVSDDFCTDNRDKIIQCFNCQKVECDNCHNPKYTGGKRAIRRKEVMELFLMYYRQGLSDEQICKAMNISKKTFKRYLKRFLLGEE